jgi:hypothetical protein
MSVMLSWVEVGQANRLPVQADRAQEGGVGDVVVADVVDLERARAVAPQQHVAGVAAEEVAESGELPVGSNLAQRVARQDRVVADVVDLVLAGRWRGIRAAQDHVRRGAGRRQRIGTGGKLRGRDGGKVRAELRADIDAAWLRAEDGAAAQIRQREGRSSVAAVGRAEQCEERLVLGDRQQLALAQRPARRCEVSGEGHDLAEKRYVGVDAATIPGRKDSIERDDIIQCQRRFVVLERLHAAGEAIRHLRVRQTDGGRSDQFAERIELRRADDGAAAQIRQCKCGDPVAAVSGPN